jgi:hypothetical protein
MATTVIGQDLVKATRDLTASGYWVQTEDSGGADVDMEDFESGVDGSRVSRFIYKIDDKLSMTFLAAGTATESSIRTHFPEGGMATLSGFTDYFVDSCNVAKSKSAWQISVSLTDIGIT